MVGINECSQKRILKILHLDHVVMPVSAKSLRGGRVFCPEMIVHGQEEEPSRSGNYQGYLGCGETINPRRRYNDQGGLDTATQLMAGGELRPD